MPTRRGVVLIILFWLATVGYIGYRDVLPRILGDAVPQIWIDFSDEATQAIPTRWGLYRNSTRIGTVSTQMSFEAGADEFRFSTKYRDLQFDFDNLTCTIPELEIATAVSRAGQLRSQGISLNVKAKMAGLEIGGARATVESAVREGYLHGNCRLTSELFAPIEQPLEPTPVPDGQVINPLQPVNRLRGVRPGMRFVIYEVNPLGEALMIIKDAILKKYLGTALLNSKPAERKSSIATVGDRPEPLTRKAGSDDCWVIEFRGEGGSSKVWVRVSDGQILQQIAGVAGETLRLEREE